MKIQQSLLNARCLSEEAALQWQRRARAGKLVRLSTSWMRPPPVFFSLDVSEDVHLRVKGSAARGISGCSRLSELVTRVPGLWTRTRGYKEPVAASNPSTETIGKT